MTESIKLIPLDEWLHESPFNPRTIFDAGLLHELAQTMAPPLGRVQSPIVVRPASPHTALSDSDIGAQQWEIVFGHRRARAARLAGLDAIPAIVREMSDEEVKRAQIVENLQREGVGAVEEADAMARLRTDHGATVEDLMKQSGKKRSFVYNRLRLASAHDDVRHAVTRGHVDAEIAQEVARLPKGLQRRGLDAIRHLSYRNAVAELRRAFQFDLDRAPFDTMSIKLVPSAGACDACTKRSDAEPVLLDECGENVCMDGTCYGLKSQTARELAEAAAAKAAKANVTTTPSGNGLSPQAAWPFPQSAQQRIPDIDPADGADDDDAEPEDTRTPEERAVIDNWVEIEMAMMRGVMARPRTTDDMRYLLERELDLGGSDFGKAEQLLGWDLPENAGSAARRDKLQELTADQLGMLMMLTAIETGAISYHSSRAMNRIEMAARFGVDVLNPTGMAAPPAEVASTPALAARAAKGAKAGANKAAPADEDARLKPTAKAGAKSKSKGKNQKDDAGVAGGSAGQVDLLAEAAS